MGKWITGALTAMCIYGAFTLCNTGFDIQQNAPTQTRAKLVECYEAYDEYGPEYKCDYLVYESNKYETKEYQRQTWNQMKSGIGQDFMIDRQNDGGLLIFLGVCSLILAACFAAWTYGLYHDDKYCY